MKARITSFFQDATRANARLTQRREELSKKIAVHILRDGSPPSLVLSWVKQRSCNGEGFSKKKKVVHKGMHIKSLFG
jgi:hypothetical protein